MNNNKFYILGIHSTIYTLFSLAIFTNQKKYINIAFGDLGNQEGKIDYSKSKILSYSYAASILGFTIPGFYFSLKKKGIECKIMLASLIIYHILPIYLTFTKNSFKKSLPDLYKWHFFCLLSIIFGLYEKSKDLVV